jgi:hypothetical protein
MALDPMMAAFESEMRDKARRRPRPAATRRAELIDNSSAPGAAEHQRTSISDYQVRYVWNYGPLFKTFERVHL